MNEAEASSNYLRLLNTISAERIKEEFMIFWAINHENYSNKILIDKIKS